MAEGGDIDLDDLARRYLDLWQDQLGALASDAETARLMRQVLRGFGWPDPPEAAADGQGLRGAGATPGSAAAGLGAGAPAAGGPAAWLAAMPALMLAAGLGAPGTTPGRGTPPGERGEERGANDVTAGAAAFTGASGGGAVDLERLLHRLAALEARIAALESTRAGDDGDAEGDPGRTGHGA